MSQWKNFAKGFIKENPIFVLLLGMCPTLGVTSSAENGLGMGLATTFIVVIATFVTVVEMVMQAYMPALFESLGLFIPLIVVNCIVLGRAEAFASKNNLWSSIVDGAGMGLGFAFALTLLGSIRELLGSGMIFNQTIYPEEYGMLVFVLAPGAFIALGYLIATINKLRKA